MAGKNITINEIIDDLDSLLSSANEAAKPPRLPGEKDDNEISDSGDITDSTPPVPDTDDDGTPPADPPSDDDTPPAGDPGDAPTGDDVGTPPEVSDDPGDGGDTPPAGDPGDTPPSDTPPSGGDTPPSDTPPADPSADPTGDPANDPADPSDTTSSQVTDNTIDSSADGSDDSTEPSDMDGADDGIDNDMEKDTGDDEAEKAKANAEAQKKIDDANEKIEVNRNIATLDSAITKTIKIFNTHEALTNDSIQLDDIKKKLEVIQDNYKTGAPLEVVNKNLVTINKSLIIVLSYLSKKIEKEGKDKDSIAQIQKLVDAVTQSLNSKIAGDKKQENDQLEDDLKDDEDEFKGDDKDDDDDDKSDDKPAIEAFFMQKII